MKMQNIKNVVQPNLALDNEEKDILKSLEKGELKDVKNMESEIQRLSTILTESRKKTKNINIRLVEADLTKIKSMAYENGLPYQTLISTILRQYVTGRIRVQL
jgi:predicted DNA binding CopG/RHH family protein